MPFRIVPERSELAEHLIQSARTQGADIFDDDPLRRDLRDEPRVVSPEPTTLSFDADTFSGN
jgi:hypothetical protein